MRRVVAMVSGLVTALMTGFLPGFTPITTQLYNFMFNLSIPTYLTYGIGSIFYIATVYNFATVILSPVSCSFDVKDHFNKPSIEDPLFYLSLYFIYMGVLWWNDLLAYGTAVVGLFAILLPVGFRVAVYMADSILESLKSLCRYPFYLFVASMAFTIPITVVILILIRYVHEWVM